MNDLGPNNHCIALASIKGVDTTYAASEKTSNFIFIDRLNIINPLMNEECFVSLSYLEPIELKILTLILFPKLQNIDSFDVKSLKYLRLSKYELESLRNCS